MAPLSTHLTSPITLGSMFVLQQKITRHTKRPEREGKKEYTLKRQGQTHMCQGCQEIKITMTVRYKRFASWYLNKTYLGLEHSGSIKFYLR